MIALDAPRDRDSHTVADFAEMLCLLNLDRVCTRELIRDRMRDVGDTKIEDNELEDAFSQLAWRVSAFEDSYPFVLQRGRALVAPQQLTDWQKLYVLLLMCANLPFLRDQTTSLTAAFERVSLSALRAIWPAGGVVRPFGKTETVYTGSKWERLNRLASDIGAYGACTEQHFRKADSGDGGIDLMAALPLDPHERRNIPSLLGQCACSRDQWVAKQNEISVGRLSSHQIHPTHPWLQALMIPHSFRDSHGSWAVLGDIGQTILFDRLRILRPLGPNVDWDRIGRPPELTTFLQSSLPMV